jgi:hypothetical protein
MTHESLKSKTDNHIYCNERIIEVRIKTFRGFLPVIDVYAPTEGKEGERKYYNLRDTTNNYLKSSQK